MFGAPRRCVQTIWGGMGGTNIRIVLKAPLLA
jgi:hypothetical protein